MSRCFRCETSDEIADLRPVFSMEAKIFGIPFGECEVPDDTKVCEFCDPNAGGPEVNPRVASALHEILAFVRARRAEG